MDDQRFDEVAKSAAEGTLFRRFRKLLYGSVTGVMLAGAAAGAASAQETDGDLLGQFGVSVGQDGVGLVTEGITINVDDGDVQVDLDGISISVVDGEVTVILS